MAEPDYFRILLRGSPYPYYRVREFSNGCLLLEPREMVAPQGITAGDLEDLENMAEAFPRGEDDAD